MIYLCRHLSNEGMFNADKDIPGSGVVVYGSIHSPYVLRCCHRKLIAPDMVFMFDSFYPSRADDVSYLGLILKGVVWTIIFFLSC